MVAPALLDAFDAFMAARKRVVSADVPQRWTAGLIEHERIAKWPLEIDGELRGAQLAVIGFPRERELMFRVGILFPAMICRLDYTDEVHSNTARIAEDRVPPMIRGPHYHSWRLNRRFFKGVTQIPRLHNAESYGRTNSFDSALRWFCAETNIESLPASHRVELPFLERFL